MEQRLIGGRYRLLVEVARGSSGVVWEAEDQVLQRRVALKQTPAPARASESGPPSRAPEHARLAHANVVRVYDGGVDGDMAYTVMELLAGEDLEHRIARVGRMPLGMVMPIVTQAATALDAAHAHGIVHGGVKAAHLYLSRAGGQEALKVIDFGGGGADPRQDVDALAAVAWRALTGRPVPERAASEIPPLASSIAPDLPPAVDAFFARALSHDPGARFQTARELAEAARTLAVNAEATRAMRVLVVDDEPDAAELIRQRFRKQIRRGDYEFLFATSGAEALHLLDANTDVDIVLSDINMPEMDGLTFLANSRAVNPLRRVVMVSAYGDIQNIRTAMNRGAFDFVTKPIDMADLEATIKKAVAELAILREAIRRWTEAERARSNLARYFPPTMVEMLATSDAPNRAARRADAAVLFADIVGFAGMAESMAPENVLALLREFHGQMESAVFQHGGTLEKYIGDALLVTFGVPTASGRDVTHALACARAMFGALDALNRAREARGEFAIRIGIGLHWGPVVLGDIGTDRNAAFVVIGDTVNTASRLQSATRELGASLVVSHDVLEAVRAETGDGVASLLPDLTDLGEYQLRGRSHPIRVWVMQDTASTSDPPAGRVLET